MNKTEIKDLELFKIDLEYFEVELKPFEVNLEKWEDEEDEWIWKIRIWRLLPKRWKDI